MAVEQFMPPGLSTVFFIGKLRLKSLVCHTVLGEQGQLGGQSPHSLLWNGDSCLLTLWLHFQSGHSIKGPCFPYKHRLLPFPVFAKHSFWLSVFLMFLYTSWDIRCAVSMDTPSQELFGNCTTCMTQGVFRSSTEQAFSVIRLWLAGPCIIYSGSNTYINITVSLPKIFQKCVSLDQKTYAWF